jgi:hypothetical protein
MPGNGFYKIPVFTLLAWAVVIAAAAMLFLMKERITPPPMEISHAKFLELFRTNQIADATVIANQQSLPLVEIKGSYYDLGRDGKPIATGIPFVVRNAMVTPEEWNMLSQSSKIRNSAPNVMVMSLLWGIAPFLILGVPLWLLAIGVLIYLFSSKSSR